MMLAGVGWAACGHIMIAMSRAELFLGQAWLNACQLHLLAEQLPQPCGNPMPASSAALP